MAVSSAVLAVIFGATFVVLAALALYFWRRRGWDGRSYLYLLFVAGAVWAFFSSLEMATADMSLKIAFAKLSYAGIVCTMPFWFLFCLSYSQRNRWIGWSTVLLLGVVPAAIFGLTVTNEWHGLVWSSVKLSSDGPGAVLIYEHGIADWALIAYSYALALAGAALLLSFSLSTYRQYRGQTAALIFGALVPMAVNALFSFQSSLIVPVDPTPVAIAAMGVIYAYSTLRYKLFDLVPVARERLITEMAEGIVVIDGKGRVIDINPAARRMAGAGVTLGQPLALLLERWPGLAEDIRGLKDESREVHLDGPDGGRWLDVRATPIRDGRGRENGRLVTLLDITKRKAAEAALETARHNFQALFDTVDDLFIVVNAAGKVVEINNAVTRRLGYSREETIGLGILSLFSPGDNGSANGLTGQKLPDSMSLGTGEMRAKDGSTLYVDTHLVAGRWGGEPVMFGICRDITERKRAEDALRESEEKFRGTIEQASEGFVLADETGRIVEFNQAAGQIFGYARDEIVGLMLWDFAYLAMAPGDQKRTPRAAVRASIGRYLATGQRSPAVAGGMEAVTQRKDGSRRYFQTFDFPVRTARGFMIGNIVTDITERKRTEDALRESEERFRLCAATAQFGTFDWDIASDRHVWSPETYEIYGIAPGTPLTTEMILGCIHPGDRQDETFAAALDPRGPGGYTMEYRIIRQSDQAMRWIYVRARVFFGGEGADRKAVRVLAAIQDITDRKVAEQQILGSLKEKEVLLKEIHHRVKNNLQIITSLLSLQISGEKREDLKEEFRVSQDRIRSMALIHEKLYMSGDLSRIDFRDYVESLVSALRRTYASAAGVRIDLDIAGVSLGIDAAIPCGLIINELVTNSLKYAFEDGRKGTVRVAMAVADNEYTLTVGDDGPGLPAGMDLWNAPSLGLRLVAALVGQLNGQIELRPAPGATFVIRFRER